MDYTKNIFNFRDRFFKDDNHFIVFSNKKTKLMTGEALKEAKHFFVLERYDCSTETFNEELVIFATSLDEVEYILSSVSKSIFDECCERNQFDLNNSFSGFALWKNGMQHYRLSELTRRGGVEGTYTTKRTYNLLDFLEERAAACAGAHAHNFPNMGGDE
jgi:hypothetical protein